MMGYKNQHVRNKLEGKVLDRLLQRLGPGDYYEQDTLSYIRPQTEHEYTPDFKINDSVYIEAKGIWDTDDRKKLLLVREQYPEITICMVFYNADYKIYKGSKTTYGDWCNEHGIPWIDIRTEDLPEEWFQ